MTNTVEWLQQQVSDALPSEGLAGGEIKRRVKALAEAALAVREGEGTAFGMHLDEQARTECTAVLGQLDSALDAWREHLGSRAGDKGRKVVEELIAAYDVRLPHIVDQSTSGTQH